MFRISGHQILAEVQQTTSARKATQATTMKVL